jgi:hypothetical protein
MFIRTIGSKGFVAKRLMPIVHFYYYMIYGMCFVKHYYGGEKTIFRLISPQDVYFKEK